MEVSECQANPFRSQFLEQSHAESVVDAKRKLISQHENAIKKNKSVWRYFNIFGMCCTKKEVGMPGPGATEPERPPRQHHHYGQTSLLQSCRLTSQATLQERLHLLTHYKYAILAINTSLSLEKKVLPMVKRSFELLRRSSGSKKSMCEVRGKCKQTGGCMCRPFPGDVDQVTPERVANYLSQRAQARVVLDAFAGAGGNTISFAQQADLVLAVEKDKTRAIQLQHNVMQANLASSVETLQGDFLSSSLRTKADLTFLHPDYLDPAPEEPSLFQHVSPCLVTSLHKAFRCSPAVMLLLPPWTRPQELPRLFGKALQGVSCMVSYSIEVQSIYVEDTLTHIAVYFGQLNKILNSEENQFLTEHLTQHCRSTETVGVVDRLVSTLGVKTVVNMIAEMDQSLRVGTMAFLQSLEVKAAKRKGSRQDAPPSFSNSDRYFSFEKPLVALPDMLDSLVLPNNETMPSKQQKDSESNSESSRAEAEKKVQSQEERQTRTQRLTMSVYSDCDIFNAEESQEQSQQF